MANRRVSVACIFLSAIYADCLANPRGLLSVPRSRRITWSVVIAVRMLFDCSGGWSKRPRDVGSSLIVRHRCSALPHLRHGGFHPAYKAMDGRFIADAGLIVPMLRVVTLRLTLRATAKWFRSVQTRRRASEADAPTRSMGAIICGIDRSYTPRGNALIDAPRHREVVQEFAGQTQSV